MKDFSFSFFEYYTYLPACRTKPRHTVYYWTLLNWFLRHYFWNSHVIWFGTWLIREQHLEFVLKFSSYLWKKKKPTLFFLVENNSAINFISHPNVSRFVHFHLHVVEIFNNFSDTPFSIMVLLFVTSPPIFCVMFPQPTLNGIFIDLSSFLQSSNKCYIYYY